MQLYTYSSLDDVPTEYAQQLMTMGHALGVGHMRALWQKEWRGAARRVAVLVENGVCLGWYAYYTANPWHPWRERRGTRILGIWVNPAERGRGLGNLLVKDAFVNLKNCRPQTFSWTNKNWKRLLKEARKNS